MAASLAKVDLQSDVFIAKLRQSISNSLVRLEDFVFGTNKYTQICSPGSVDQSTRTVHGPYYRAVDVILTRMEDTVFNTNKYASSLSHKNDEGLQMKSHVATVTENQSCTTENLIDISSVSTVVSPMHQNRSKISDSTAVLIPNNTLNEDTSDNHSTDIITKSNPDPGQSEFTHNVDVISEVVNDKSKANIANSTVTSSSVIDPITKPTNTDSVKRPHWRSVLSLFLCRMMLPVIGAIIILQLFIAGGLVNKNDHMMQLIIIIESCAPPAPMVIVSLNQLELSRTASAIAYLYLFTYVASILTMTFWMTVAMSLVY